MKFYFRYLNLIVLQLLFVGIPFQKNFAQENIDSLKSLIKTIVNDSVKIKAVNNLMENISFEDEEYYDWNERLKELAEKGLSNGSISAEQKKNYLNYLGNYYNNLTINPKNSDFVSSLSASEKSYEIFKRIGDSLKMAHAVVNNGICYSRMNMYDRAIAAYFDGLKSFERLKDEEGAIYTMQAISNMYLIQKKYPEAISYYQKELQWYSARKERTADYIAQMASINQNMGSAYLALNKLPEAGKSLKAALELAKEGGDQFMYTVALAKTGKLMHAMHQDDKALNLFRDALSRSTEDIMKAEVLSLTGDVYLAQKKYSPAEAIYKQGLVHAKIAHSIVHMTNMSKSLYELYKATGQAEKSLASFELYTQLKDSTKLEESKNSLKEQQLSYEFEKKEMQTNAEQEKKLAVVNITNEKKAARRNMLLYTFISIAVLLLAGIFFVVKYFHQRAVITANKNNELKQRLLLTQMNPHFIFNSVDNIQSLIYNKQDEEAVNYLTKFSKLTRQILENSRENYISLSEELHMLENYITIQKLLHNNNFSYRVSIDENIDTEAVLLPPMLTQPFIENAIKHGLKDKREGGKINVRFYMNNRQLFFEVTDNGSGLIAKENESGQRSLSTQITRERLESIASKKKITIQTLNITGDNNSVLGVKTFFEIPYVYNN